MGIFTGTLPTWVGGEDILAADLDAMTDALEALTSAWTTYVPVLTSTAGAPTVGNGTLTGRYRQLGKTVDVRIALTWGSTTSYGTGNPSISLPVEPLDYPQAARGVLQDLGTNTFVGAAIFEATSKLTPVSASGALTSTSPFVWATGDKLVLAATYEAA